MRTYSPKASEIQRAWHVVDAEGLVLGRLCTEVARVLRGKHKPIFAPHLDTGDHVIVVNADKVVLDRRTRPSSKHGATATRGYPGGLKTRDATRTCSPRKPEEAVRRASAACCRRARSAARCSSKLQGLRRPRPPARRPAARAARARRAPRLAEPSERDRR